MAINIKNERTVALARELAAVRGVTLTSAIEEALERRLKELENEPSPREARAAERERKMSAILAEIHASITPEQREALRTAERDMYDDDGLPIW